MRIGIPFINDEKFEKTKAKVLESFPEAEIIKINNEIGGLEIQSIVIDEAEGT